MENKCCHKKIAQTAGLFGKPWGPVHYYVQGAPCIKESIYHARNFAAY